MKWQKKLTKAQLRHVRETTSRGTLSEFMANRDQQLADMKERETPDHMCAETLHGCWECREIAKRLAVCDFKSAQ